MHQISQFQTTGNTIVGKKTFSPTEDDGFDHENELVDEVVTDQVSDQFGATQDMDVTSTFDFRSLTDATTSSEGSNIELFQ